MRDMIRDGVTGRLVAPGDSRDLADALLEMLGDPERCRRFGEAGHRLLLERYTWQAVGARMRSVIAPLIGRTDVPQPAACHG